MRTSRARERDVLQRIEEYERQDQDRPHSHYSNRHDVVKLEYETQAKNVDEQKDQDIEVLSV